MWMFDNAYLYNMREIQKSGLAPINVAAIINKCLYRNPFSGVSHTNFGRSMSALAEMMERATNDYPRPEFGIKYINIGDSKHTVKQENILKLPFGNLEKFSLVGRNCNKKLLIVAPMSGHYATLLRGTITRLLEYCDIWVTDWANGRDVTFYEGAFDFNDYISYLLQFIGVIGGRVHLMGVCQPTVQVLSAAAILSSRQSPIIPKSMILIGGPLDARKSPTKVNELAHDKPIEWFETNVITRVPMNHAGFMRRVYPGFLQLGGFMTMNLDKHVDAHMDLFEHLIAGDGDSITAHKKFYDEYLSVADIPAEFYLETIERVFQKHLLPRGKLFFGHEKVDPHAIKDTALLTIEGELDDISGIGQTQAAHTMCKNIPKSAKQDYIQKSVGHYGIFNGRRFRNEIAPMIGKFIAKHN